MNIGIILAAGRGSRLKCSTQNKTSLQVKGKPMVVYGVELFAKTVDKTVVVVGAFSQSVKTAIGSNAVIYANQTKRLGTGHALKVALRAIEANALTPTTVLLGYGDHMTSYTPDQIEAMIKTHQESGAAITMVTAIADNPEGLGRIVRKSDDTVKAIVEQKDATDEQKKILEINAGLYCFSYDFIQKHAKKLRKSHITREYYLTDLIQMAQEHDAKVVAHIVPFEQVGTGVNTREQLEAYSAA